MTCILVVEADSDIRELFVNAIRETGLKVVEAVTADAAVELLDLEDIRLVVTDINLPGRLTGIDLALAAREGHPEIPLIFVSGLPAMLEEAHLLCKPACYLQKPFALKVLIEHVQRGMERQMQAPDDRIGKTSEDESKLLLESITDYAIFTVDPRGYVASWNSGAEQIKGYSTGEAIGMRISRFFTTEDQARARPESSLKIAKEAGRFEEEGWRVRKDGSRFWAKVTVAAIRDERDFFKGFAVVTRDISDEYAAQEALRSSERRLRLLVDNVVHYAIYTMDVAGHVTSWNPGAEIAKGYTKEEILGKHFSLFYTSADQANDKPATALRMARESGRFEDEGWRVRKNGTYFWASVVVDPIRDETGELVGFAEITRDINEKRLLEEAREQLYRAQKMETIGQLTGGVAHDFNNLLAAVMGSLELIAANPSDLQSVQRLVNTATRATNRGAKLTQQLLSFSRRQLLHPEVSDINDLIMNFEELLRRATGESIEVRINLDPHLWPTQVDRAHFQSALLNIVVNARDAMPKGGILTIETQNVDIDEPEAMLLTEIEPGSYVIVTIRDTGHGMTSEVKARATEPFYTTKDVGQGSGLGLSQTQGFVRQSKGQLEIQTAVGVGTSVSLYLPKSDQALRHAVVPVRQSRKLLGGTILVVEDDAEVLEVAILAIESFGYAVHAASDGETALAVLRRDIPIDLLFTDVVMPLGLSGVALAREACKLRPELRVLLASGYPAGDHTKMS